MAYGDGGFYFLQPVNNGYGAISFNPGYGKIVDDKKFGKYQTYRSEGPFFSADSKSAEVKELNARLRDLVTRKVKMAKAVKASKKKLKQYAQMDTSGMGTAHAKQVKKIRKQLELRQAMLADLKKATKRMVRSVERAKKKAVRKAQIQRPLPGPQFKAPAMPSFQRGDESAPAKVQEIWEEEAVVEDSFVSDDLLDIVAEVEHGYLPSGSKVPDHLVASDPVIPEPPGFYEENKQLITVAAAAIGVGALVWMLRK